MASLDSSDSRIVISGRHPRLAKIISENSLSGHSSPSYVINGFEWQTISLEEGRDICDPLPENKSPKLDAIVEIIETGVAPLTEIYQRLKQADERCIQGQATIETATEDLAGKSQGNKLNPSIAAETNAALTQQSKQFQSITNSISQNLLPQADMLVEKVETLVTKQNDEWNVYIKKNVLEQPKNLFKDSEGKTINKTQQKERSLLALDIDSFFKKDVNKMLKTLTEQEGKLQNVLAKYNLSASEERIHQLTTEWEEKKATATSQIKSFTLGGD